MKISEAMYFKRELKANCGLEVAMIDSKDGIILMIAKRLVDTAAVEGLQAFVSKHNLNLALEIGNYYISTNALSASF